jgi:predicted protein tyrosine phosphatase
LRSPTAEHLFADVAGVQTLSAGTDHDADERLTDELVDWADVIFVMERPHRAKLLARHRRVLKDKRVVVLRIRDDYGYLDPQLISLLRTKMRPWLPDR